MVLSQRILLKPAALLSKLTSYWGCLEYGLISIVAAYTLFGILLAAAYGQLENYSLLLYSEAIGLVTLMALTGFAVVRTLYIMLIVRPKRLVAYLYSDAKSLLFEEGRLLKAVPVVACFLVFMSSFTSLKAMIPLVHPFSWDSTFVALDQALHGGVDPWRLLHPFLAEPTVTSTINAGYNCWFFVMFGVLYWQLFSARDRLLRMQFFYTYFLCWVINGTLLAMLFSSAGPCFYEGVTGIAHYEPLMSYLASAAESKPVWALNTQAMLWDSHTQQSLGQGAGISAMPSMHVSVAVLLMFLGWRKHRLLGALFTVYALAILVGSVHLAWHYAIDAYVAFVTTSCLWYACGRLVPTLDRRRQPAVG